MVPLYSNASYLLESNTTSVDVGKIKLQSANTFINWKLASNEAKTKKISCSKNKTISISITLSKKSGKARIGVIDADNTYHVKSITGSGSFSFKVPSTGTYKIYCKNTSSFSYTAGINYSIQ